MGTDKKNIERKLIGTDFIPIKQSSSENISILFSAPSHKAHRIRFQAHETKLIGTDFRPIQRSWSEQLSAPYNKAHRNMFKPHPTKLIGTHFRLKCNPTVKHVWVFLGSLATICTLIGRVSVCVFAIFANSAHDRILHIFAVFSIPWKPKIKNCSFYS